jgi:hypothetical protein
VENDEDSEAKEIDVLMISHKFDTSCLYITLPELYEPQPISLDYGSILDEVMEQIFANSIHVRY